MSGVVLTREAPRNDALRRILSTIIPVDEVPLTSTRVREVRQDIDALDAVTTLVVTSARGASAAQLVVERFAPRVIAVGSRTARHLRNLGIDNVEESDDEGAASVARMNVAGRVAIVGAAETRPELPELLSAQGIAWCHIAAYETVPERLSEAQIEVIGDADGIVIAAPSAWRVVAPFVNAGTLIMARGLTTAREVSREHDYLVVAAGDAAVVAEITSRLATNGNLGRH